MAFSQIIGFNTSDTGAIGNTGRAPETGHRVPGAPCLQRLARDHNDPDRRHAVVFSACTQVSRDQVQTPETQATANCAGPPTTPSQHVIGDPAMTQINQSVQPAS